VRSGRHPTGYYFLLRASQVAPDPDQPHSPPIQTSHTAHPSRPAANRKLSRIRFPNLTAPQAFGQLSTRLQAALRKPSGSSQQTFAPRSPNGKPRNLNDSGAHQRKVRDSNPRYGFPHNGFQDRHIRPLCQPSFTTSAQANCRHRPQPTGPHKSTELHAAQLS
jgi:hypothetical protein